MDGSAHTRHIFRKTVEESEAALLRSMTDEQLLAAYQRTDGEPGNAEADALLAEISRRGLDI